MCAASYAEFWVDFTLKGLHGSFLSLHKCPTTGTLQHYDMVTLP